MVQFAPKKARCADKPKGKAMRIEKATLCMMASSMLLAAANAATFHWKDDAQSTSWTNKANYVENVVPSAGDIVEVGSTTVYLSDSDMDSFNLASSLGRVRPTNANARIEFTINGTDAPLSFGASIRYHNGSYTDKRGKIVKKGLGRLELTSRDGGYAYSTDMEVVEGILSIKTSAATSGNSWFGDVAISNDASFVTRTSGRTWVQRLYGEGTVTNTSSYQINVSGGNYANPMVLTPWMSKVGYYSCGRVMIWRTDNRIADFTIYSQSANVTDGSGTTGFYSIGMNGKPSSVGTYSKISTAENGGTFLYLGDGNETGTDKHIEVGYPAQSWTAFDAGAYGGLKFTGEWRFSRNDERHGAADPHRLEHPRVRDCRLHQELHGHQRAGPEGFLVPHHEAGHRHVAPIQDVEYGPARELLRHCCRRGYAEVRLHCGGG